MDLNSLIILNKVASLGSFTQAGRVLGIPKSTVSAKISQLEVDLGALLLERSTRSVRVTPLGERVVTACRRVEEVVADIRALAEQTQREPQGPIRIAAPADMALLLLRDVLGGFLERYPQVAIELEAGNRYVDLIQEDIDIALRASMRPLDDASLVAVTLGLTRQRLFRQAASPWHAVSGPQDLAGLPVLAFADTALICQATGAEWQLRHTSALRVRDMVGIKEATLAGLGIGLIPSFMVKAEIKAGQLLPVLPEWSTPDGHFFAVYPSRRFLTARLRALLDHLKASFMDILSDP